MQAARERGADVLLISEQHKWSENSAWYQDTSRRAGILVCSPDLNIGDFLEIDAGFVWGEVAGVRVYSCYFSPNDPFEIFETQILLLEESLKEASGRPLIAGDFNSKSPEWREARLDRRRILVGEMQCSKSWMKFTLSIPTSLEPRNENSMITTVCDVTASGYAENVRRRTIQTCNFSSSSPRSAI